MASKESGPTAGERPCVLAFDLGTGGAKVELFDSQFRMMRKAYVPYESRYPAAGMVEQRPQEWWDAIRRGLREILEPGPGYHIEAIGVAAMTPVLVACDGNGNALRPAMIWMDRRAHQECGVIDREIGDDLFHICGNHNDPSNFGPKAMWLQRHEPEVYSATAVLHSAVGYLVQRMTGVACADVTQCGLSQLCDTRNSRWDERLVRGCGLDMAKLPPIVESSDVVGALSAAAANELGLPAGIPVVAGSMDNVAAGLGLGVVESNEAYVSAGTATNLCVCSNEPVFDRAFHLYRHVRPGHFLSVAGVDSGGAGVKWLKELLGDVQYEDIDRMVASPSVTGLPVAFLPYMVGQRAPLWNDVTRGVLMGLHPSTTRADLFRALMEGNAVGVRRILSLFQQRGFRVASARMTGGASLSSAYTQIFADALGMRLDVFADSDVSVRGAAVNAAVSVGLHDSFEAVAPLLVARRSVEPEPRAAGYYRDMHRLFDTAYEHLQEGFRILATIQSRGGTGRTDTGDDGA